MTFIVTASTPDSGIIAGCLGAWSYDAAENHVTLLPGRHSKIWRRAGGFVGGGGPRIVLELVVNALAAAVTPHDLQACLRRARPAIEQALAGFRPAQAEYARTVTELLWVGVVDGRCRSLTLNWLTGDVTEDAPGSIRAVPPFGLDRDILKGLLDDYAVALSGCRDGNVMQRATDALFAAVHERCPHATREFELAGVSRTARGFERWRQTNGASKARTAVPTSAQLYLGGGATIASQGMIKWVPICVGDVVTFPNGEQGFQITQNDPPRAIFHEGEVQWLQVGPGFAERVPEYYVPYNWNVAVQKFGFEHRGYSGPGLLNLGIGRNASQPTVLDTDVAQWIVSDGTDPDDPTKLTSSLARRIAARQTTLLGTGMMLWRFRTTYAHPELTVGDAVVVPTDRFVATNPITGGPIVGRYIATAVIVETSHDARTFGVWIRQWSDIQPALQTVQVDADPKALVIGYSNLVPTPSQPWALVSGYARPAAATGAISSATRSLSQAELPNGARITSLTATYYLGNASAGAADISISIDRHSFSGSVVVVDQLVNIFDDAETNAWQTVTEPLATEEVVDWDTYTYVVGVTISATGTVDNSRFSGAAIEWK